MNRMALVLLLMAVMGLLVAGPAVAIPKLPEPTIDPPIPLDNAAPDDPNGSGWYLFSVDYGTSIYCSAGYVSSGNSVPASLTGRNYIYKKGAWVYIENHTNWGTPATGTIKVKSNLTPEEYYWQVWKVEHVINTPYPYPNQ